jgi:2,4-dienoyl-CoA reductase-like NADH-dependent reductase (Old Yellow Enzyme family)
MTTHMRPDPASQPLDAATNTLFRPLTIQSLKLANRIVMAPMTRTHSPGGVPGADVAAYYRRRAEAGVGLILSEGTVIDRPASSNHPDIPRFHGKVALDGWSGVIAEVHAAGGRMGPQIWHVGSVANDPDFAPAPAESPSGLLARGQARGKAMTDEDIADTIAAFASAAADARRLGFDMVELHGAHGYLIDSFFWGETNLRKDGWGGATLPERSRFAAEVVRAVRAAAGPDFALSLRVSQWKGQDYTARMADTPDALQAWLLPLVEAGVDILHCSQRRFWQAEFPDVDGDAGLNLAGWAKKLTGAVTISVGSVGLSGDFVGSFGGDSSQPSSFDNLAERMDRDEFDLVAVGRALLNDARWVAKIAGTDPEPLLDFSPSAFAALT